MTKYFLLLFLFLTFLQSQQAIARSYDLEVKKQNVFITGKAVEAILINGQIPAPTLYFKEGEHVEIRVKIQLTKKHQFIGMEFYCREKWMASQGSMVLMA